MKPAFPLLAAAVLAAGCAPSVSPVSAPAAGADYPTTPPPLGPAPSLKVPAPVTRTLPNGLSVWYVRQPELPVVQAVLVTRGGQADDPASLPGLAAFTASMLDEGAAGRSALEFAEALELLGASLSTGATWDAARLNLYVLRSRLPEALALMADAAVRPDFPANEVQRIREQTVTEVARARDNAGAIAGNAFASLVYGSGHPYGRLPTTEGVRGIDRAKLADFHRSFYRPGGGTLVLVGDVDVETVHPLVERAFGSWTAGVAPASPPLASAEVQATRLFLIDKPGAPQSEVRIGHPGVARDNPDYFPLLVLNTLLGGSFTSRLNSNLRETHGYTYGARSSFAMRQGAGPFLASAAVTTAKTDSSVIEFFRELSRIRSEPVAGDELERAKNYVALGLPRNLETTGAVAGGLADLATYGLDASFYDGYVQNVMAVSPADIQRVANRYLRPDRSVVVVVGDRKAVEAGLRSLPIGALEVRRVEEFVR